MQLWHLMLQSCSVQDYQVVIPSYHLPEKGRVVLGCIQLCSGALSENISYYLMGIEAFSISTIILKNVTASEILQKC